MNYKHITLDPSVYGKLSYGKRFPIEIVDELEATPSSNDKVEILKKALVENAGFRKGVELCYSPRIKFYIRQIPDYIPAKASAYHCVRILDDLKLFYNRLVTGSAAVEKLRNILEIAEPQDAEFISRIVQRDLGCGVSGGLINKAAKAVKLGEIIPEFPVMLCSAFDKEKLENFEFPAIAQTKMDGMRVAAVVGNGTVNYFTRNGNSFEDDPAALSNYILFDVGAKCPAQGGGFVLDGEMLVVNKDGKPVTRKEGNGVLTRLIRGTSTPEERNRVRFVVWDIILLQSFWEGEWKARYADRLSFLKTAVQAANDASGLDLVTVVKTELVNNHRDAMTLFNEELANGNEGIILKSVNGIWKNARPKWQLKMKAELEMDAVIVGVQEGTGKYEGKLGALICRAEDKDGPIEFNVGSGFDDAEREEFWKNQPIGQVVNVKYNEIISSKGDGPRSLFLPIFVEVRSDVGPF
jgi:ATP-dependent DNA ligase